MTFCRRDATDVTAASGLEHFSTKVLELRQASRQFGTQEVLRDVSLTVERGETLVLIGESGCGKSVTTKLLAGLLPPSSGTVFWHDQPLEERTRAQRRRDQLQLGYLFQGAALFDSLTVFENVAFGLRENQRLPESAVRQIVFERLREVGLPPEASQKRPADLSGGMRKRVGLARALALSPQIMFYDEPTTGLDPVMSDIINELILQTQQTRAVTSVVVTHDMTTVRRVADRVAMLQPLRRLSATEPQVIFCGTADELFETPDVRVSRFVRGDAQDRMQELAAA